MRWVCSTTPSRPLVILNQSTGVYLRFKKRLGSIGGLEPFHQFSIFRWVPSHLRISTSKHQPDFMFWTENTQSALNFLVLRVIQQSWVFFHVEFNQRFRKKNLFCELHRSIFPRYSSKTNPRLLHWSCKAEKVSRTRYFILPCHYSQSGSCMLSSFVIVN